MMNGEQTIFRFYLILSTRKLNRLKPWTSCPCLFTVALIGTIRAEQVLWDGSQGEAASSSDVPWLECKRQLCNTGEKEEKTRADESG